MINRIVIALSGLALASPVPSSARPATPSCARKEAMKAGISA